MDIYDDACSIKLVQRKPHIDLCSVASAKMYVPGALHIIVIWGIERKPIFKDSLDYRILGIRLSQLIEAVAARLEVDVELVLSPSRQRTVALARSILCCLAVDQLMLSNTFAAGRLNLTPSAVSELVSRERPEAETRKIAIDYLPKMK